MVKSGISKKQSQASGSAQPTGSESAARNQFPSISFSNFRAIFKDHPSYNDAICLVIKYISNHPLFGAFDSFTDVVPQSTLFKCAFYAYRPLNILNEVHPNLIDDSLVVLTKEKFLSAINLRVLHGTKLVTPSVNDIITTLYEMGYQKKLKGIIEFKKKKLPAIWQLLCHFIIRSLSGEPEALRIWA